MASIDLTAMRRSLWEAINLWPALKLNPSDTYATAFKRTFTFDQGISGDVKGPPNWKSYEPTLGELPAIGIAPGSFSPKWDTNQQQDVMLAFDVFIWTDTWYYPAAEALVANVIDAIWQATRSGEQATIVKQAFGLYPEPIAITYSQMYIGKEQTQKVLRTNLKLIARTRWRPR